MGLRDELFQVWRPGELPVQAIVRGYYVTHREVEMLHDVISMHCACQPHVLRRGIMCDGATCSRQALYSFDADGCLWNYCDRCAILRPLDGVAEGVQ